MRGGPAEKAGLEEGNRIAAINGVNLRANAADIEDYETPARCRDGSCASWRRRSPATRWSCACTARAARRRMKVRTVSSDSLFRVRRRSAASRATDFDDRPALGIGIGSTGSRRDTLGVLVMSVQDSSPAARAGLEEGNRIAAINGVNLRVAREDADDPSVGQREGAAAACARCRSSSRATT